eukprot:8203066-Alexandrium_andersonii.AAC.1
MPEKGLRRMSSAAPRSHGFAEPDRSQCSQGHVCNGRSDCWEAVRSGSEHLAASSLALGWQFGVVQ